MPRDLKPFERRYTPEQTRAVVHAMIDAKPRLTAREVVKRAAAGTLPGSELPPFGKEQLADGQWLPIPEQTAYAWKRRELESRAIKASGRLAKGDGSSHALRTVLASSWDDLERSMKIARNMKMQPIQRMRTVREAVQTAKTIHDAEKALGEKPGATKPEPNGQPEKPPRKPRNTEADALARAARERAQTERHDAKTPDTQQGQGPVTGNGHHAESNTSASDSGVGT